MTLKHSLLSICLVSLLVSIACSPEQTGSATSSASSAADISQLAESDLKSILLEPDRLDRVEALLLKLRQTGLDEAGALGALTRDRNLPMRELERVLLVSRWAQLDPAGATEWAVRGTSGELRKAASREAAFRWASVDPEALVQAYDINQMANGVPELVVGLVEGWHESGKTGLDDYIRDFGRGETRQRAIDARVRLVVRDRTPEDAMAWARAASGDREFRRSVYSRIGAELVEVDPKWSVQWCEEVCETDPGAQVASLVGPRWAETDGPGAMAWLFTQKDEVETWATIRATFRRYLIANKEEAIAWLLGQDRALFQEQRFQGPLGMVLNEFAWRDADQAMELSQYLTSKRERNVARITIARRFLIRDPEAAEAWLGTVELTEEQIATAREIPENSPAARRAKNYKDRDARQAAKAAAVNGDATPE